MKARFIFRNFIQHTAVSSDGMARIHIFPKKFDLKCPNIDYCVSTFRLLRPLSTSLMPDKFVQSQDRSATQNDDGTKKGVLC